MAGPSKPSTTTTVGHPAAQPAAQPAVKEGGQRYTVVFDNVGQKYKGETMTAEEAGPNLDHWLELGALEAGTPEDLATAEAKAELEAAKAQAEAQVEAAQARVAQVEAQAKAKAEAEAEAKAAADAEAKAKA